MPASTTIPAYISSIPTPKTRAVGRALRALIDAALPKAESKIWHRTPVWFDDGNPLVSIQALKNGTVKLMFFSGQSFREKGLVKDGSFKAASFVCASVADINPALVKRWCKEAKRVQWDYKNIVKRRGTLVKLTEF